MKPIISFTIGDVNGIGPEVVLKAITDQEIADKFNALLIGPEHIWKSTANKLKIKFNPEVNGTNFKKNNIIIKDVYYPYKSEYGKISEKAGDLSVISILQALDLCLIGFSDAMVTAPISKEAINKAKYFYDGHTGLLAALTKNKKICMMLVSQKMRVGLVTTHTPINNISKQISKKLIIEKLEIINKSLIKDFGIQKPNIAVLGLNPHSGDGGVLGNEEKKIIIPAINSANKMGIQAIGPFASDAFFARYNPENYDAILAMYHDQGLIPFKMTDNNRGVNFTAGLKIIRTSPDHGTGFDIAGKFIANHKSMVEAIKLAIFLNKKRKKIK